MPRDLPSRLPSSLDRAYGNKPDDTRDRTDMQQFFGTSPPSVHRMVVELEKKELIRRIPRQSRSIEILIGSDEIPPLRDQPIKSSAARY